MGNPTRCRAVWAAIRTGDAEVGSVNLSPVGKEMRVGVGNVKGVKSVAEAGFMISPLGSFAAMGRGEEVGRRGEKDILHLHGG